VADIVFLDSSRDRAVLAGASCAFGVFDGVHRGHRFLIDQARASARETGGPSVVLTFDIDPDELFHPARLHKLLSNEERLQVLSRTGVDAVAVLRFTREFAALTPRDFLATTFDEHLPATMHVGHDIRFGCRASGTIETLESWGSENGVLVVGHELVAEGGRPITATRIRLLLESGDEQAARDLLS